MSKGLKKLERINHTICLNTHNIKWDADKYDHCACVSIEDFVECYETVEKELKEYEGAKNHIEALHKERVENSLKLKALEIVKPYIHIYCVAPNDRGGVRIWFTEDGKHYIDMPQEEFDLLKEVLDDAK